MTHCEGPPSPLSTQFITKYGYKTKTTNKNLLVVKLLRGRPAQPSQLCLPAVQIFKIWRLSSPPDWEQGFLISYLYSNQQQQQSRIPYSVTRPGDWEELSAKISESFCLQTSFLQETVSWAASLGLRPEDWDEWKCISSVEWWFLPPEIDVCGWTELTWCFVLLHSNIRHCSHREKIVYSSSEVIIDNVLRMSY